MLLSKLCVLPNQHLALQYSTLGIDLVEIKGEILNNWWAFQNKIRIFTDTDFALI